MSKPRFSILSMLLMMSVAGLALALFLSQQKVSQLGRALEKSVQTERYLQNELGTIDADDGNLYVKELENQVPLVRRYRVLFPQGNYRIVAGSFLGGEFSPENVLEEVGATIHLKMSTSHEVAF